MHIQVEEKVEREQVAKVTGTNKDEGPSVKGPVKRTDKKIYPNDLCPVSYTHLDVYKRQEYLWGVLVYVHVHQICLK